MLETLNLRKNLRKIGGGKVNLRKTSILKNFRYFYIAPRWLYTI